MDYKEIVEAVFGVSGALSLLMAVLPQGKKGGVWDKIRTVVNYAASNFLNAKNIHHENF